jgi:CHASE1-domain containing sensor protein
MKSGKLLLTSARKRTIAVVVILALGLTLTFILFQARLLNQTNRQSEFSQRAALGATALQRSMQEHLEVLYGLAALYATAAQPLSLNREAFRELTKGPLKRYPGVQSLGWIPRVSEAEREAYLAAARKDGISDFQMTEWTPKMQTVRAARHDMYYPIFYIEPLEQNRAAVGFNLGSVPAYMEAMQKALSTEGAVASAWRSLAQDTGEQFGFLLFVPMYKNGVPHRTFEERRMSLQGFTMAMFRLDTLVEKSLGGMALGTMGLELADVTDAASKYLLSLQLDASRVASFTFIPRQNAQTEAIRAGVHWETTFNIAGRTWSMLFHPMSDVQHTYARQEWGILVGGLLCTLLCAGFFILKGRA